MQIGFQDDHIPSRIGSDPIKSINSRTSASNALLTSSTSDARSASIKEKSV